MKLRSLTPLAAVVGLWLGGHALAETPARPGINPIAQPSNQALADSVAAQLQRGGLRGYTVDISAVDGVVELTGRVADAAQHDELIRQALAVPGVKRVVDGTVTGAATPYGAVRPASAADQTLPPPLANPIIDPIPVTQPVGAAPYDLNPPKLPPYAWPTYAPYNNFSRVAYPLNYPSNAFPFIGPFYPFPKVPLGWRSVSLEWQDGHWWYGRRASQHDYWRVRYW